MQCTRRVTRPRIPVLSARSLLSVAVSDALIACRKAADVPRREPRSALVLATAALLAFASVPAQAVDWTGAVSSDWFAGGNWSSNTVPVGGTQVVIDITVPHVMIEGGSASAGDVIIGRSNTAALTVGTGGTLNTATILVGTSGNGTLDIQDGGVVDSTQLASIGNDAGSESVATVTGAGSIWTSAETLYLGHAGHGTLNIVDGGGMTTQRSAILGVSVGGQGTAIVEGNGSSWTNLGELSIGGEGEGALTIRNGGNLANGGSARIGDATGALGEATVTGADSHWSNSGQLYVGRQGQGTLTIADGGSVEVAQKTYIGSGAGSHGAVAVDGVDSRMTTAGELIVGGEGGGMLDITAGGTVDGAGTVASIGGAAGGQGTVTVDGAGSSWVGASDFVVGWGGTGQLVIQNGGLVGDVHASIGVDAGSAGTVTIGADSRWTSAGYLGVGISGDGTVAVQDGGTLESTLRATVGRYAGAQGKVIVEGNDALWAGAGEVVVGDEGIGTLDIVGGGAVTTGGAAFIAGGVGGQGTVTVSDGSDWSNAQALYVGNKGIGKLVVQNGGSVSSASAAIGVRAGSTGEVRVTGADSSWINTGNFVVGEQGNGTLTIGAGGLVQSAESRIGGETGSTGSATVTGAGSQWEFANSARIQIGSLGNGTLSILDGARVSGGTAVIADQADSTGAVTVGGTGSIWAQDTVFVGSQGDGTLDILGGGAVSVDVSLIGDITGSVGRAVVDGAGSIWTTTGRMYVGGRGGSGRLLIQGGGHVDSGSVFIGFGAGSAGEALVTGADARWVNSGDFTVGNEGNGALTIEEGASLNTALTVTIGGSEIAKGIATVDGPGSSWIGSGDLDVGYEGTGQLVIRNGGVVSNTYAAVGVAAGARGEVEVTGAGSGWSSSGSLVVGQEGNGALTISSGGKVNAAGGGVIGRYAGAQGVVAIDGIGSSWSTADVLGVGIDGNGTLNVIHGGSLSTAQATIIGDSATGQGVISVDGAGSSWTSSKELHVGEAGDGALAIRNGGQVSDSFGGLGVKAGGTGSVTVTGTGSSWTHDVDLYVGIGGAGTTTIAEGGMVGVTGGMFLANQAGSTGTLNIGAAAGEAAVGAGTLDAGTVAFGAGAGTLNFNHTADDYAFGSAISGAGTVNVWSGTTRLTGGSTYTGTTDINGGTLLVEGALGVTATTVADGATLGGSGSIAGDVTIADGGILAPGSSAGTLTVGSLSLSSGSILDYELGQAGVIGSGVNDLTEVTGDVALDGTLNIIDIGGFGSGVYRLINYGGDLTDHGLELGALPGGAKSQTLFLQTAIDGQVNLVNSAGLTLTFWDGAVGAEHDNAAIDGGDGSWTGNDRNWTQPDGAVNGHWSDGEFAVFGGAGGTVDVIGEHRIAGLQFMSGYTLAAGADGLLRIDGADSVIRVDPGVAATIAAPITGAGGLVKTDAGTLVLSGNNGYLGGTTIRTGTLSVSSDANLGDASGGLAFDGGTLQTTAAFDSARDVNLQADGGTFLTDMNLNLSGGISGAGALIKDGVGTLALTGANAYTGGTRVLDGTLIGDTSSIRGNLANDGTVVFDQGANATFDGTIAGDGTMTKRGVGTLTLTGNSALDWTIDAGELASRSALFSGDVRIVDGALLRFHEQGDGRYAGTLSGAGRFEIEGGDSAFALTGNSAGFTGTISLVSGTLQLDGTLGGSTVVAHGAALVGTGTLRNVDNHGTIAPGHSIGTLTLTGDYIHHEDATLMAEIAPDGSSDLLHLAGTATLDGGTLQVTKLPGQYQGGTRYTVIDAKGGVTGTFATLDQDLPFLDLLTGYDANHVYLDVQRNDVGFNIVCGDGTFNQCQVAGALDRIAEAPATGNDLKATLTEVTTLNLPGAQAAFDRLSGEAHGSLAGMLLEGHALYGQTVSRRLAERRDEAGTGRLQAGSWVRVYGNSSDLDGDGNAHAADVNQRGVAVGLDARAGDQWLVGASLDAMSIAAQFRPGDHGEADIKNASLYAAFESGHAYLDVVTSYGWWDNDVTRRIAVGSIERGARSEYGGHRLAAHLEAGWTFALGAHHRLQPLLSVEYAKVGQQGFREHGAQDLDLIGSAQDVERTTTTAGLRWSTAFARGGWMLEPTVEVRWLHTFGDAYAEQELTFAGAPGMGYRVRGVSWPRDRGLLGVGLRAHYGDKLDLFIDVDHQQGGGLESRNIGAGIRWRW